MAAAKLTQIGSVTLSLPPPCYNMCSHQRPMQTAGPPRNIYPERVSGPGAKWVKSLTNDRTGQFIGGRYSDLNLSSVLFTERVDDNKHVELKVWSAPGRTKPTFSEAMSKKFKPARKGDSFGPSCKRLFFHISYILIQIQGRIIGGRLLCIFLRPGSSMSVCNVSGYQTYRAQLT